MKSPINYQDTFLLAQFPETVIYFDRSNHDQTESKPRHVLFSGRPKLWTVWICLNSYKFPQFCRSIGTGSALAQPYTQPIGAWFRTALTWQRSDGLGKERNMNRLMSHDLTFMTEISYYIYIILYYIYIHMFVFFPANVWCCVCVCVAIFLFSPLIDGRALRIQCHRWWRRLSKTLGSKFKIICRHSRGCNICNTHEKSHACWSRFCRRLRSVDICWNRFMVRPSVPHRLVRCWLVYASLLTKIQLLKYPRQVFLQIKEQRNITKRNQQIA